MAASREIDVLFLSAAKTGDMSMLQGLTESYQVRYTSMYTPDGHNALHLAAKAGKKRACRFLIENLNFDVNGAGTDGAEGETALCLSVMHEHRPTSIFLIESGADVNKQTALGLTPLHYAAKFGSNDTIELLLSKGADLKAISLMGTPLHAAALSNNHVALKCLLDLKADPNPSTSYHEHTPLVAALKANARECVKLLLEAGADPNHPCYMETPLKWAACNQDVEIIECMLKAGADPNVKDSVGNTPLESAAFHRPRDVVELLFSVTSPISKYPHWSPDEVIQYQRSMRAQAEYIVKFREVIPLVKAKAAQAFQRKNYADAGVWYALTAMAFEVDAKLLSNRSLCATKLNMGNEALADAQACIKLNPRWAKAHYREGAAWIVLKEFKKAADSFSQALALDPGNEEIKKAYMEAQAKRNKFKHWNEIQNRSYDGVPIYSSSR